MSVYFLPSDALLAALPEPRCDVSFVRDAVLAEAGGLPGEDDICGDMAPHVMDAATELLGSGHSVKLGWAGRLEPRIVETPHGRCWSVAFSPSGELQDDLARAADPLRY